MDGVLCPVLVGRSTELAALTALVADARAGRGGVAVLVGEAGVGKSRLVRETAALAADRGFLVLSGRAVPGGAPLPFRPLTEALLAATRGQRPPHAPELAGFGAQVARLVPDWGTPGTGADGSPVLVGEAVLRLLRVLGGTGSLLVLEDLHWADPETLAVVDYLADALPDETSLCLTTTRPTRPSRATDLLDRLAARRAGIVLPLTPLTDAECARMVTECLSGADVDDAVPGFVAEHSDGLPFLVEELLAGLVTSGTLVRTDGGWRAEQRPTPSVPASFAESVRTRLQVLNGASRQVLAAAAVLGRRFDWDLLPGVAGVDGATAVGHTLLRTLDTLRAPARRRVDLLLLLVRAALAAGDTDGATADLAAAHAVEGLDGGVRASLDAVAAHVALAGDRLDEARRLATAAARAAAEADLPEVACEAVEVLGRLASAADAAALFRQAADLAERHGLTTWRLRALQELVLTEATLDAPSVRELRRAAADAGAHVTVAQMDLVVADMALDAFDHDTCLEAAERCADASRRYGLASLPVALLWLAGAHALGGRGAEMEAVLAEAADAAPGDPRVEADAWGRVRAMYHALREDRDALRDALERSMEFTRVAPEMESVYPGQYWWALLRAQADDDLGRPALAEIARSRLVRSGFGDAALALVDAVVLGRQGRAADAGAAVERARTSIGHRDWSWYGLRLAAEAAVRDGWGEPVPWLREAEAFFAGRGHDRVARECRTLLVAAGAPAVRRGRGRSAVPPALRRLGITSRELDVLALVAAALPTREIAARLFLSPRTVEHHVASLLARTGSRSRTELAAFARANQVPAGR